MAVKLKGTGSTAKCYRCAKNKTPCDFTVDAGFSPAALGAAGPSAPSAAGPSAAELLAIPDDRAPVRAVAAAGKAAGKRSAAFAFARGTNAAATRLPTATPDSSAPLQQVPEHGARPDAGAEAVAVCPASIELSAVVADGVGVIPAAARAAAGATACVAMVLAAVRTVGEQLEQAGEQLEQAAEQLEQERAVRLRQAAEYDGILDKLTARNDELRAAIDSYKTAAHVSAERAATAEAELASVRGRGADMARPVALAPRRLRRLLRRSARCALSPRRVRTSLPTPICSSPLARCGLAAPCRRAAMGPLQAPRQPSRRRFRRRRRARRQARS
jgi:hypothetical protein